MTADCRALELQLAAYADDELGVDAALEIERHVADCAPCRRALGRQRHLARALRELHPAAELPADVESRIRFALFGATSVRRAAIAGAVAITVVGIGGMLTWRAGDGGLRDAPAHDARASTDPIRADRAIAEPAPAIAIAAALHRQADDGELPLELASADVGAVNAWLRGHLPFAGAVGDPGSAAITLAGVTRVTLGAHPAGLVRYRLGDRTVSLFLLAEPVWTDTPPPVRVRSVDFRVFQRRGLDVVAWSHAAVSYLLISEDGLTTGDACAACHGGDARGAIAEFVAAVTGKTSGTGML